MSTDADALVAIGRAKQSIPQVIRRLSLYFGVTAADLAAQLHVTRAAVSSRLNGRTVIKSEELAGLALYFGVPVLVFYLSPDDALRWVIDHPEARPGWFSDQGRGPHYWKGVSPGQRPQIPAFSPSAA